MALNANVMAGELREALRGMTDNAWRVFASTVGRHIIDNAEVRWTWVATGTAPGTPPVTIPDPRTVTEDAVIAGRVDISGPPSNFADFVAQLSAMIRGLTLTVPAPWSGLVGSFAGNLSFTQGVMNNTSQFEDAMTRISGAIVIGVRGMVNTETLGGLRADASVLPPGFSGIAIGMVIL